MIATILFIFLVIFLTYRLGRKLRMEKLWQKCIEEGNFTRIEREPFPGALCTAALVFYNLKDVEETARIMENIFGKGQHKNITGSDWPGLCRTFSGKVTLNRDLLTEYLASIVYKKDDNFKTEFIPLILKALKASEFMWNARESDIKSSEYLSQLLSISDKSENREERHRIALSILNLPENASRDKINREYRKLVRKYHPDYNKHENAAEMFMKIQAAYDSLQN